MKFFRNRQPDWNAVDSSWGVRFNPLYGAPPDLHDAILKRYPFTIGDVIQLGSSPGSEYGQEPLKRRFRRLIGTRGVVVHVASDGDPWVQCGRTLEHWPNEDCVLVDEWKQARDQVSALLDESSPAAQQHAAINEARTADPEATPPDDSLLAYLEQAQTDMPAGRKPRLLEDFGL